MVKNVVDGDAWEMAYWEWLAKYGQKRFWWFGWNWKIFLGSDEMSRRTLVLGPLVIALWRCRCEMCVEEKERLEAILASDIV